ncbi:MAG: electron transport complex protein RnfC [Firmicutes bacterium HGW-Firmicutes-14]|nr:MAG: electron transport complex protein RnfC [Firmicutes bacterium HGW-Firmicutes-14]
MNSETVNAVMQAGVVGAGGAGFPTHVKISAEVDIVIVNGAECEPLLRVDQQLMVTEAERVIQGLEAVMEATGAVTGIIALKSKYMEACDTLEQLTKGKPVRLFRLEDFFPAGDEQVMVYEVAGRVVPEGGLPLMAGCVVTNVETMLNVANALAGIPVTDTYVTITGEVKNPVTVKLPLGTPVIEALALAGVTKTGAVRVIDGGPMMGQVLKDLTVPVTKVTKGLIVLPEEHHLVQNKTLTMEYIIRRSKSTCIQCRMCSDMCPRNLLGHRISPHLIMRGLNHMTGDSDIMKTALLCCECGVCELYACPMLLSPKQVNSEIKKELTKNGIKFSSRDQQQPAAAEREYRKIPSKRLIARLGLTRYDVPAGISEEAYCPDRVYIPLRQHIGAPAVPTVKEGQQVEKGDLIAAIPKNALGANLHASVKGTVKKIGQFIEIAAEGERGGQY